MDAVTLAAATAAGAKRFAPLHQFRARELPGIGGVPTLMASPPTVAHAASSGYAGSVPVTCDMPGAYTYSGGIVAFGANYPDTTAYGPQAMWTAGTTIPPWNVEAELDIADSTGRFEVHLKANSTSARIAVGTNNGPLQYLTAGPTIVGDNTNEYHLVTMGAAGRYRVRIELDGNARFFGINVGATDTVRGTRPYARRMIVVGDSFTEPTIIDPNPTVGGQGWVQQLSLMLGVNGISCGLGGSGYLNPGPGGKTFRQRSADWLAYLRPGDVLVFAGGINDTSYAGATTSAMQTEAAACFALCPAGVELVVLSPFWRAGFSRYAVNLLAFRDAIKAAAVAARGTFLDVLSLPPLNPPAATTLTADATTYPSNISTAAQFNGGTYMQIGTGTNAEVRMVTGVSGSGPYSLSFGGTYNGVYGGGNLSNQHTAGEQVIPCGPGIVTGTGHVGALAADGNADRYTGSDATHPTAAGHFNIAAQVMRLYAASLPA